MKRTCQVILSMLMLLMFAGCKDNTVKPDQNNSTAEVSQEISESESSEQEEENIGPLLMDCFGKLWTNNTYDIEVDMNVKSTLEGESDNIQSYSYRIAIDSDKGFGMLDMQHPDESNVHLILRENKCYKLNDSKKEYETAVFENDARYFGEIYTTQIYLGTINNIVLESSGNKDITDNDTSEKIPVAYEQYRITSADEMASSSNVENSNSGDIKITYYFRNGQPYSEILNSDRGQTVIRFRKVSDKISDNTIFDIPKDYTEIS